MEPVEESMPFFAPGRRSYRPEEIKAYGIKQFMRGQEARGPLSIPDLKFTEEENRVMDEVLAKERRIKDAIANLD